MADARHIPLADESVQCVVTSPPYWGLRDYGIPGQLGLEASPDEYVTNMVAVFREVRRVLKRDGTVWLNLGDSYGRNPQKGGSGPGAKEAYGPTGYGAGKSKLAHACVCGDDLRQEEARQTIQAEIRDKDLIGIPWRVAFALQEDGWYLRSDIIWSKPNPMPESVRDRPTKAHDYIFLLTKEARYYYDQEAVKVPASPDTHARYGRGRSESHKWAGGGPGNQTIAKSFEHMRKPGVHPKAAAPNSGIRANTSFSEAVKDVVGSRNIRSVWTIATQPYSGAHFATFPEEIPRICILAGTKTGDTVLDPFAGSGTTVKVARNLARVGIGLDLSEKYLSELAAERIRTQAGLALGCSAVGVD